MNPRAPLSRFGPARLAHARLRGESPPTDALEDLAAEVDTTRHDLDRETAFLAAELVRELARIIGGGGGGRPDLAEAGGKNPARLDEALRATEDAVARRARTVG